ncbi:hypothetical protein YB2330_001361 [Saitoella coloradoensis]
MAGTRKRKAEDSPVAARKATRIAATATAPTRSSSRQAQAKVEAAKPKPVAKRETAPAKKAAVSKAPAKTTERKIAKPVSKKAAAAKKAESAPAPKNTTSRAKKAKFEEEPVKPAKTRAAPAKKAAESKPKAAAKPVASRKRTAEKTEKPAPEKKVRKPVTGPNELQKLSTEPLNVYVFGTGDMCQLGLGPAAKVVKRPRLNANLGIDQVGVVGLSVGGMHSAAVTKDGKVLTWGVGDAGALGRNVEWDGGERDADGDDEEDDVGDMNPLESTPAPFENVPEDIKFVDVSCGDNVTVAITKDGDLWSCGQFRSNEGELGFSATEKKARFPVLLPGITDVVQVACGTDHFIAITVQGHAYAWGNGQQMQLGRKTNERNRMKGLSPQPMGNPLKKVKFIGAGSYHSFAVTHDGKVYAWGLNQFGQCGVEDAAGEDESVLATPTRVPELEKYDLVQITGGEHHSAAVTKEGDLYTWGRINNHALGMEIEDIPVPPAVVIDGQTIPKYLPIPTKVEDIPPVAKIFCGSHHNVAICKDGSAWSWGYSESYAVGQGNTEDDIVVPTQIENTAIKDVELIMAGCGAEFSVICGKPAAPASEPAQTNGEVIANGTTEEAPAASTEEPTKVAVVLNETVAQNGQVVAVAEAETTIVAPQ